MLYKFQFISNRNISAYKQNYLLFRFIFFKITEIMLMHIKYKIIKTFNLYTIKLQKFISKKNLWKKQLFIVIAIYNKAFL